MTKIEKIPAKMDQFDCLSALLQHALGDDLSSPDSDSLLDIVTDDIVFEFPFPLPNGIHRIDGKPALETYLPKVGDVLSIESFTLDRALRAADGKTAVVEFSCQGSSNTNNARYDQTYVSVLDLRDGRISRYRDYWNPLVAIEAVGAGDFAAE